jgi:hypothetical protein
MPIHFDISDQVKTRFGPSRLRNWRVKGWDRILIELRTWWDLGMETIMETGFYERLKNVPRELTPLERWLKEDRE